MAFAYQSLGHSSSAFFACSPELGSAEERCVWQSPAHMKSFQSTLLFPWLFLSEPLGFIYWAAPHTRHCVMSSFGSGGDRWENRELPSVSSELWFRSPWNVKGAQGRSYRQDIRSEKASQRTWPSSCIWEVCLKCIHSRCVKVVMLGSVFIHDSGLAAELTSDLPSLEAVGSGAMCLNPP